MATYTSQYPTHDTTHVKATTYLASHSYPHLTTNPALSLTGTWQNNAWLSFTAGHVNQRFHVDLGSQKIIRRIYYENFHSDGLETDRGANSFTFWGSNTEASFLELTYGTDTGWVELTVAQNTFDIHVGADQADPKYVVVTNATAYQYYAFKFADGHTDAAYMGVRRIELQTEEITDWEYVGTGTFTYSGTAIIIIGFTYAGSGDFTYSGIAGQIYSKDYLFEGSGELAYSGSGICHYEKSEWEYAGSGELTYSGEATQAHTKDFLYDTSGNFVFSGTGIYSIGFTFTGGGSLTCSGEAIQIYGFNYSYAGSGVFAYSGEAVLRWGDWAEITKGSSNFTEIDKKTSNWSKVEKGESDWNKTIKL